MLGGLTPSPMQVQNLSRDKVVNVLMLYKSFTTLESDPVSP